MPRYGFDPVGGDEWRDEGACLGMTELFYSENAEDIAQAKSVCRTCPVITKCREFSIKLNPEGGVWAGRTSEEVKKYRKRRRSSAP